MRRKAGSLQTRGRDRAFVVRSAGRFLILTAVEEREKCLWPWQLCFQPRSTSSNVGFLSNTTRATWHNNRLFALGSQYSFSHEPGTFILAASDETSSFPNRFLSAAQKHTSFSRASAVLCGVCDENYFLYAFCRHCRCWRVHWNYGRNGLGSNYWYVFDLASEIQILILIAGNITRSQLFHGITWLEVKLVRFRPSLAPILHQFPNAATFTLQDFKYMEQSTSGFRNHPVVENFSNLQRLQLCFRSFHGLEEFLLSLLCYEIVPLIPMLHFRNVYKQNFGTILQYLQVVGKASNIYIYRSILVGGGAIIQVCYFIWYFIFCMLKYCMT